MIEFGINNNEPLKRKPLCIFFLLFIESKDYEHALVSERFFLKMYKIFQFCDK